MCTRESTLSDQVFRASVVVVVLLLLLLVLVLLVVFCIFPRWVPHRRAVHAGAVHKHHTGQGRVVLAATVGVADRLVVEGDVHRPLPCLSLADLQCVAEIVDDVANVLDADRHTYQIFADPGALEILG